MQKVIDENLDMLLYFGRCAIKGKILDVCRFGVVQLHFGERTNGNGPIGFWEVYHREPATCFTIHHLSNGLFGSEIFRQGRIPTSYSYVENQMRIILKGVAFLHLTIDTIFSKSNFCRVGQKSLHRAPVKHPPPLHCQFAYLCKTVLHISKKLKNKLLKKTLLWNVAYQAVDDWKCTCFSSSIRIKNLKNHFFADPFIVTHDEQTVCFVEDYDFSTGMGSIAAIEIGDNGAENLVTVLEEPFHLSFPFVFCAGSEMFMCPETLDKRAIQIYRCQDFPYRWQFHKVLVPDVFAVDTCVFWYNGFWWMLSNIDSAQIFDCNSELHVFYSDSIESDVWQPHPMNPVVFDSRSARNGGFFFDGGIPHRIFQVQGFDMYGKSMGISRIFELTTESYREEIFCEVEESLFADFKGIHTFTYNGKYAAFDFVGLNKFN